MNKTLLLTLVIMVVAAAAGLIYHLHHHRGSGPLYHVRNEFEFTIRGPYNIAAPLFGPEGERAWASGGWDPHFLHPQPPRDIEGAVFQVNHGHHRSTWVNTVFDLEQGRVQYVYMIPDVMVTRIDIHLSKSSAETTGVQVAYERTALSTEANEHVRQFGDDDRNSGKVWGDDIQRYLAARTLR